VRSPVIIFDDGDIKSIVIPRYRSRMLAFSADRCSMKGGTLAVRARTQASNISRLPTNAVSTDFKRLSHLMKWLKTLRSDLQELKNINEPLLATMKHAQMRGWLDMVACRIKVA